MNMLIMNYYYSDDKLIVGSLAYKEIIEESLGLTCVYNDDAVMEVMWGVQNIMHTLVPQEQYEISKEDLILSHGLNMILNLHDIVVKKDMINECIIEKASKVHHIDMCEEEHLVFLHERLLRISGRFPKSTSRSGAYSNLRQR